MKSVKLYAVVASVIIFGLPWLQMKALAAEPKLAFCNTCSGTSQFAQAAESAALSQPPFLIEGVQEIYVINAFTEEVGFFVVRREFFGDTVGLGDGFWSTTSTLATAPGTSIADIQEGISAARKFLDLSLQDIDIRDLDLGVIPVDSAVDLVGPDDDAVIATRRLGLANAVGAHLRSERRSLFDSLVDLSLDAANRFIAEELDVRQTRTVKFEDGSEVSLKVTAININDGQVEFEFEILPDSINAPGLPTIPGEIGAFLDFFGTEFFGDPRLVDSLGDLFVRANGRTDKLRSGNSCGTGSVVCWTEIDPETGKDMSRCRVILPKAELNC